MSEKYTSYAHYSDPLGDRFIGAAGEEPQWAVDVRDYHPIYEQYIGKQVCKRPSGKPFKSGNKINTVKGIINHPQLNIPAFTFEEDDSYVECRKCEIVTEEE